MTPSAVLSAEQLAYIGLGSNLGDPRATVQAALAQLRLLPASRVIAQSNLFHSAPVDADGDDYVNAALCLHTTLTPSELLKQLQLIEQTFGRQRSYRNAPRTLDLDLLLYGQRKINSAELTIPHPRMTQRAFVLLPLLQIEPSIVIPGKGYARDYLAQVADQIVQEIAG